MRSDNLFSKFHLRLNAIFWGHNATYHLQGYSKDVLREDKVETLQLIITMPKRATLTYTSEDAPHLPGDQLSVYYCKYSGKHAFTIGKKGQQHEGACLSIDEGVQE